MSMAQLSRNFDIAKQAVREIAHLSVGLDEEVISGLSLSWEWAMAPVSSKSGPWPQSFFKVGRGVSLF